MFDDFTPGDQSEYARAKRHVGRGVLDHLSNFGGSVANLVGLPVSSVLDVAAGQNPLDQWQTPLHQDNRMGGREMLRAVQARANSYMPGFGHFIDPDKNTYGNFVAGMAAETTLDPTALIPGRSLAKAVKTRNAAVKANADTTLSNVKNFIHNAEQKKILKVAESARDRVVKANQAAGQNNLDLDLGFKAHSLGVQEAREQLGHVLPHTVSPLPANHTVDVLQPLDDVRKRFAQMPYEDALHVSYGPPIERAQAIGRHLGLGPVKELRDPRLRFQGHTTSTRAFEYSPSGSYNAAGFNYSKHPHEIYVQSGMPVGHAAQTIDHELAHSMMAQHPETLANMAALTRDQRQYLARMVHHDAYGWDSSVPKNSSQLNEATANALGHAGEDRHWWRANDNRFIVPDAAEVHRGLMYHYPDLKNESRVTQLADDFARFLDGDMHTRTALTVAGERNVFSNVPPESFAGLPNVPQPPVGQYINANLPVPEVPTIQLRNDKHSLKPVNNAPVVTAGGLTAASLVGRKKSQDTNNGLSGYRKQR